MIRLELQDSWTRSDHRAGISHITTNPSSIAREQAWGENPSSSGSRTMARASSRRAQSRIEGSSGRGELTNRPGGTTVAWRGSAHAATAAPSQGKAPTSRRQSTTPTSTRSHRGEGQATRDKARGRHGRDPERRRRRRREHQGVIDQISQTGRCAVVGSIDCDPSRRLTPAEAVRIKRGGSGATQSPELKRERRKR
jgi:hypothetical protein